VFRTLPENLTHDDGSLTANVQVAAAPTEERLASVIRRDVRRPDKRDAEGAT